jgi:TetR/AcrR family transcriptional regulator, regulator of cefoperazone and chloramphenicol sensitivity
MSEETLAIKRLIEVNGGLSLRVPMLVHSRQSTRETLLNVAETLFGEKGFAAVGIREIADNAGANIAAIKYHFGSKNELYQETVRRAMSRGDAQTVWDVLNDVPGDRTEAATVLVRFIHQMLSLHLTSESPSACCRLMMREAAEPSEAIDSVVRDYILPRHQTLVRVIAAISGEHDPASLSMAATSVLSQVLHYRIFKPFIERMRQGDVSDAAQIRAIGGHIARFSLRGLSCPEPMIAVAVRNGLGDGAPNTSEGRT